MSALPDLSALLVQYSDEQLRIAADELSAVLGLNVEWNRWDSYLASFDRSTFLRLIGWIQRWRTATTEELERVDCLTAVIRAAVRDGDKPRLLGYQLDGLAADIERVVMQAPEQEQP